MLMQSSVREPQVAEVTEGQLFHVETIEWTGGQIKDDDSAEDIKTVDLKAVGLPALWSMIRMESQSQQGQHSEACQRELALRQGRRSGCSMLVLVGQVIQQPAVSRPCAANVAMDLSENCATQVHYLSGPINVKDKEGKLAQPGDLLAVEICNLGPLPGDNRTHTWQ